MKEVACSMGMVDELRSKLAQELGRATDDIVLDQLSRLLIEWLHRGTSVSEAKTQLGLNPALTDIRTLISFTGTTVASGVNIGDVASGNYARLQLTDERSLVSITNATVPGGVSVGDIAGGDLVKIQLQQGIFITIQPSGKPAARYPTTFMAFSKSEWREHSPYFEWLEFQNCYAICIGINKYGLSAQLNDLRFAEDDARAMYESLLQIGFVDNNCQLLLGVAATTQAIYEALKTFLLSKPGKNDLVIIYFAGHCLPTIIKEEWNREQENEVFLVTYDFDRQKMKERGEWLEYPLRLEQLSKRFFEKTRSERFLVFIDSCYSEKLVKRGGRDHKYHQKYALQLSSTIVKAFNRLLDGREAIASCLPYRQAIEDRGLLNRRFASHLRFALAGEAKMAVRRDGWMTASSLFEYLNISLGQHIMKGGNPSLSEAPGLLYYQHLVEYAFQANIQEDRIKALLATAEHHHFIVSHLNDFVERESELQAIHQHIGELKPTGGYVIITGVAGQGTSSMIAKLVRDCDPEQTVHHFILPENHRPDYQVKLLRDLMAQLVLKHHLDGWYVSDSSPAALADNFQKLLVAVAETGSQELIVIDGLHQIEEDSDGRRNLTFLPSRFHLPPQMVFVIGTRPNDTLRALKSLQTYREYCLPMLKREHFDRMLERQGMTHFDRELENTFYTTLRGNALYLKLAAQELAARGIPPTPEDLLRRLPNDPGGIFSLQIDSLKKRTDLWRRVIRPTLGLLLTEHGSLSEWQIRQHLREDVDYEDVREGLEKLGGLITQDEQGWYTLCHPKLQDYLQSAVGSPIGGI